MKEKRYWDFRYKQGGTSGEGSIGIGRAWKWGIIGEAIRRHSPALLKLDSTLMPILSKVIDVGCGDLSFWNVETKLAIFVEDYIGIDISDTIITKNQEQRINGRKFIVSSSHILNQELKAPVVFCMDLLFHIMDDMAFIKTLKNLCHYSEDLIFIHSWKYNSVSDGVYMKYRPLEAYFGIFMERGFTLVEEKLNPNKIGTLYIFKRSENISRR